MPSNRPSEDHEALIEETRREGSRQLAERPASAITGLTEEHFAPLGVSDFSERSARALPPEMVALGVREGTAPVRGTSQP